MKLKRYIASGTVLFLICSELCSSTLLAGAMFYYMVGNYIGREVVPNIFKALLSSSVPSVSVNRSQQNASSSSSQSSIADNISSAIQIANALGLNRRIDRVMQDLWPELDCSIKPCNGNSKKSKKKVKPKKSEVEEDDSAENISPNWTISEELLGYGHNKKQDEISSEVEHLANEELADQDPYNFYFIMKDQHKKEIQEKQKLMHRQKARFEPPPRPNDRSTRFYNGQPRPPLIPHIQGPPPPHIAKRRGLLPIFIRYRKQIPTIHVHNSG